MSNPTETGGRPLAYNLQQLEGTQPSLPRRKRTASQSSDERVGGTKSTSSRRRPVPRKQASSGSHAGASGADSSTMQQSGSPKQVSPEMSSVNYTRTGRVSKAKKGLKVHECECGRTYTRAEHLRRHQKNHAQNALVCEFPQCGKTFYRIDLLQRHQERHNEIEKESRGDSYVGDSPAPNAETQVSLPAPLTTPLITTFPQQTSPYYHGTMSPVPAATPPPRYTPSHFRTPHIPSSAFGSFITSSPISESISNQMKQRSYAARQQTVTIPVAVEGLHNGIAWNDPFSPNPNYSSSSGYASPVPGAGDYANMFAHHPYGPVPSRTRTSSNASFVEPWVYPAHSPASATSTMAYTWTSNDKMAPATLAYMNATSFPMANMPVSAGVDPVSGYGQLGPKTMAQRDEEEQAFLFPEQSFGMGQIADSFPFEQYFDNYWRLFHPSFPVVHRVTFRRVTESPMLRAAMVAVGAQYSNDPSAKRRSRILHDRCLKLLDRRDLDVMAEPERLCDYQALFLVEVLSQYRARRAALSLSTRFESLYQKLSQDFRVVASRILDVATSAIQSDNATDEAWDEWISLASQQRLLLGCYILEYQQAVLLARSPRPSVLQCSGFDLPFPCHFSVWETETPIDWVLAAQHYAHLPAFVFEISPGASIGRFDRFQSALYIAAQYNHLDNPAVYISPPALPAIDHLIEDSATSKHALLTAKLLQVTPIRALLAIPGESWILSENVPSRDEFENLKLTLRAWVTSLWTATTESQSQPVHEALKISLELLQHAVNVSPDDVHFDLGADMGLYFAALVVWAVTVASYTRINAAQASSHHVRYQSQSPLSSSRIGGSFTASPLHFSISAAQPSHSPNPGHPATLGLISASQTSPALPPTSNSMLCSEFTTIATNFLDSALLELNFIGVVTQWPRDVSFWQQGCAALLRWVKMRLRNGAVEGRDSVIGSGPTSAGTGRGADGLGDILDGAVAVLEKILGRGWDGWAI